MLPRKKRTRPSNWSLREIIDGILYQLKNGCNWNDLPRDFPPLALAYLLSYASSLPMVRTIFDKKAIHRIGCSYKEKAPDR
ncbi:transposase [Phormidium sp. CLA17]|uniref:transposase n=1 Tax=Leptolyngbya sp. Cla-17 TaxID=2803751 RepID=UPI0014910F8D|nr:transposase [Leptolyngbya sp. Cla-17]